MTKYSPDGYNVGFNAGVAAGQTVDHLHIHVIPRYAGDMADPRGGVRHVIPSKGNYLRPPAPVSEEAFELFDGQERLLSLELNRRLRAPEFDRIDFEVSFVMRSGLNVLLSALTDALDRGAILRILTTDYMQITDADALARLLDLADGGAAGSLETRVFHDNSTSFHPKAYLFWSSHHDLAAGFVGSNNLSHSGIAGGVEWAVGVDQVTPMLQSFERLWTDPRSQALSSGWLEQYRSRRSHIGEVVPIGVEIEPPVQPATPRPVQREALAALEATRAEGFRAGLVVMATGLGKTWVAAFDSSRPQFHRVLFIAHREEILRQSRDAFRQVQTGESFGLYFGGEKQSDARVVFASIATLASRLHEFAPEEFDYIVVDEFHHAAARSYRKVIDYFSPKFLLGLTATPERMDGADLLSLCADNLVFESNLIEGIRSGDLCPFQYHGIKDIADFAPIPWRNGRFDPELLAQAIETQDRAQQAFDEWYERRGKRTVGFCVSTSHASFMASFFTSRGVKAVAVHSGHDSAPRGESLELLRNGEIDVIFAVDVFNEGLDLPGIDTVLMLRPTESPVVFLQQLGRGLRTQEGKAYLTVIDLIGNHRSFLARPRTLLSLGGRSAPGPIEVLDAMRSGEFELPPGCSVHYELEVVDMLSKLVQLRPSDLIEQYCRDYADEHGYRPTALQVYRAGFNPDQPRKTFGSWFAYLRHLGLLTTAEADVVGASEDVLLGFQMESINKAYKLVTLKAMILDGTLRTGSTVGQIASRAHEIIRSDPRLLAETVSAELPDPASADQAKWAAYWRKWPLSAWSGQLRESAGRTWFQLDGDQFSPRFALPDEHGDAFDAMVAEIVEYRLAKHLLAATVNSGSATSFQARVFHSSGKPILQLDRNRFPHIPEGETEFLADGRLFVGRFVKIALNVANESHGGAGNLTSLLRSWFGPSAGLPGTSHRVEMENIEGRWVMRPVGIAASSTDHSAVALYPTLEVACGDFDRPIQDRTPAQMIELTADSGHDPATLFVAFARGDSMDGGTNPIRHGDPLLLQWATGSREDYIGQVVVAERFAAGQTAVALKRLERDATGFQLVSENSDYPSIRGEASLRITARLIRVLSQTRSTRLCQRGRYEHFLSRELARVVHLAPSGEIQLGNLEPGLIGDRVALHLSGLINQALSSVPESERESQALDLISAVQVALSRFKQFEDSDHHLDSLRQLLARGQSLPTGAVSFPVAPQTSLLDSTLIANTSIEGSVTHHLNSEFFSAADVDIIVAFIRKSGIKPLEQAIRDVISRGGRVRVLTTVFTGTTEKAALDLLEGLGAEVKVSYNTAVTRLHAKAWIFHRPYSVTTAYIGSSNLTYSAQVTGVEWNLKLSSARDASGNPTHANHLRQLLGARRVQAIRPGRVCSCHSVR
jgi:superfamily II DNA or RNA helicase/HKD family nuclease/SOS-response transcriptional repressor LexA